MEGASTASSGDGPEDEAVTGGPESWTEQRVQQGVALVVGVQVLPFALFLIPPWLSAIAFSVVAVIGARRLARYVAQRRQRW